MRGKPLEAAEGLVLIQKVFWECRAGSSSKTPGILMGSTPGIHLGSIFGEKSPKSEGIFPGKNGADGKLGRVGGGMRGGQKFH